MSLEKIKSLTAQYSQLTKDSTYPSAKNKEAIMIEALNLLGKMFGQDFSDIKMNGHGEYIVYNKVKEVRESYTTYEPFPFELSSIFASVQIRSSNPTARKYTAEEFHAGKGGFVRINHFEAHKMFELLVGQS